jgi:AAA domain
MTGVVNFNLEALRKMIIKMSWLPKQAHTISSSPEKLKYLIIAPPKWGKTTLFSGCPNCLLLAFEAGYGFVECPKVVVNTWNRSLKARSQGPLEDDDGLVYSSALEVVEELERFNPYTLIIIDTIDEAVKMCSQYNCEKAHVEHPSEGGDFGRGWSKLVTEPVRQFYGRLARLGSGLATITHSKETSEKDKFEKNRFRRATTLSDAIQQFVVAQSDVIMHGFYLRKRRAKKDRDRYVSFDGSDEVIAGTRINPSKVYIPSKYILAPEGKGWEQWTTFFQSSPEAGKAAEKEFVRLASGADDESLTVETEDSNNDKSYVKAKKDSTTTAIHSQSRQQLRKVS